MNHFILKILYRFIYCESASHNRIYVMDLVAIILRFNMTCTNISRIIIDCEPPLLHQIKNSLFGYSRLSTISKMNRIFVLDQGGIIEYDSYSELLEPNGK